MKDNSNIEKLKMLAAEISRKEQAECDFKNETVSCLSKIKDLLCRTKVNKKVVLEEVENLIAKLS
jgi:hypothetical protein